MVKALLRVLYFANAVEVLFISGCSMDCCGGGEEVREQNGSGMLVLREEVNKFSF